LSNIFATNPVLESTVFIKDFKHINTIVDNDPNPINFPNQLSNIIAGKNSIKIAKIAQNIEIVM
jgi:hypothetical protein